MAQTSRDIFSRALTFKSPERLPRDLWTLPWATSRFPEEMEVLKSRFSPDMTAAPSVYRPSSCAKGDIYAAGHATDDWGCVFENLMPGVHGEVRDPIIKELSDWKGILTPPYETLPTDVTAARDAVRRFRDTSDKFIKMPNCPRPWERWQFLRGTENAMVDLALGEKEAREFLKAIHDFYLRELEFWARTDVDALLFMDDWGSQTRLLVSPEMWREWFKPLYREYCQIAHANNKFMFMHSDGCIIDILPDLIEVGVTALNSQLFTMDLEQVGRIAKGKITFWGEIDRQHVLPKGPDEGRAAVRKVARHLWKPEGGIVAHMELGPGANPKTVIACYEEWERVQGEGTERVKSC